MDPSDPMAVLRPTFEEFQSFSSFVEKNSNIILQTGIVKVIPPKEWKPTLKSIDGDIEINAPRAIIFKKKKNHGHFESTRKLREGTWTLNSFKSDIESSFPLKEDVTTDDEVFWKALPFLHPLTVPLYSVDNEFTLFDNNTKEWNLNNLGDPFSKFMASEGISTPGVTSPFVYIGSRYATFNAHKEDMDLWSILYLHEGSPKQWYGVPAINAEKLDKIYEECSKNTCEAPERHKHIFLDKNKLPSDVKVTSIRQEPGTFVITGGSCYHWGFNWGVNIGEAVNFAPSAYAQQKGPRSHSDGKDDFEFDMEDFKSYLKKTNTSLESKELQSFKRRDLLVKNTEHQAKYANLPKEKKAEKDKEWKESKMKKEIDKENVNRKRTLADKNEAQSADKDEELADKDADPFHFSDDEDNHSPPPPKKRRGRPRKEEKLGDPSIRPLRKCPYCNKLQGKNFKRHVETHEVSNKEYQKVFRESTRRTAQGVRVCNPELLPSEMKDLLKDDVKKYEFQKFLDDIGAVLPESTKSKPLKMMTPLTNKVIEDNSDEEIQAPQPKGASCKAKLEKLGYPEYDDTTCIIKSLKALAKEKPDMKKLIEMMLTPVKRILGYVQFLSDGKKDWQLLTLSDKVEEYTKIMMTSADAQPSTCKNYVDHMIKLQSFAESRFFQDEGMPKGAEELNGLLNQIKLARVNLEDLRAKLAKERDQSLAGKKWQFGKNLPDISDWEKYLADPQTVSTLEQYMKSLEEAPDDVWMQLENDPASSPLRERLNYTVEYVATSLLFLAARPGEIANCTLEELKQAEAVEDGLHVLVAKHKTGRIKQAVIEIPLERKELFYRYQAILERFSTPPLLAFPFLSPNKGFTEQTNIYRRMNLWLSKHNLPLFTCTKLRKTVETSAALFATDAERKLVGSGLNHSGITVERSYNVQTRLKNEQEKSAVKKVTEEAKVRKYLEKRPALFSVNLKSGPLTISKLQEWIQEEWNMEKLVVSKDLYNFYLKNWQECVLPILYSSLKEGMSQHKGTQTYDVAYENMDKLLSIHYFLPLKHQILANLRKEKIIE